MQKITFKTVRKGRHSGKQTAESIYIDIKDGYTNNHAGQITVQTTYSTETGEKYDNKPQEHAQVSVYLGGGAYWEGTLLHLIQTLQVDAGEVALLTAVITHNCFDELYKHYNDGEIFTCDACTAIAGMFEAKYRHVTEWAEYLESIGYDGDWEEFVIDFANTERDNIPALKNQNKGGK